jgi:hypothetical protein
LPVWPESDPGYRSRDTRAEVRDAGVEFARELREGEQDTDVVDGSGLLAGLV